MYGFEFVLCTYITNRKQFALGATRYMIHSIYSFFILFIEANFSFFIYPPLSVMWRKII